MGILTPHTEHDNQIIQPQTTRWRFPYRAPRDSERLNAETSQIHYDLARLYKKIGLLSQDLDDSLETFNGEELNLSAADFGISWGNVEAQYSLQQMALILDKLNQRLSLLERERAS